MMRYHEFRAMNTSILLAADGPVDQVDEGFKCTEAYIHASEQRFTRFSPDSELSRLNQSAGSWFQASNDLYVVVELAVKMFQDTGGLFDPSILLALENTGYDRSMDEIRAHGVNKTELRNTTGLPSFSQVCLDPENKRILLPEGLRMDLGGIAKGWIAEQAAVFLSGYTSACAVDAGGDAFMIGRPAHSDTWRITLEDPSQPNRGVAILKVQPGAIATSSIVKRRWQQGNLTRHHIIDPRTKQPAETDWLSVTVVADHAAKAEVFAKCLLIGGSREVNHISTRASGIEFIVIDQANKLWGSQHSRELLDV